VREREVIELELARGGVGLNLAESAGGLAGYVLGELVLGESHELGHGRLEAARPDEAGLEDGYRDDTVSRGVTGADELGAKMEALDEDGVDREQGEGQRRRTPQTTLHRSVAGRRGRCYERNQRSGQLGWLGVQSLEMRRLLQRGRRGWPSLRSRGSRR
jgi:hypothetical protein